VAGSEWLGPKKRTVKANYVLAVLLNSEFHFELPKIIPTSSSESGGPEFSVNIYIKLYKG
jgi:hypothetical protein